MITHVNKDEDNPREKQDVDLSQCPVIQISGRHVDMVKATYALWPIKSSLGLPFGGGGGACSAGSDCFAAVIVPLRF